MTAKKDNGFIFHINRVKGNAMSNRETNIVSRFFFNLYIRDILKY